MYLAVNLLKILLNFCYGPRFSWRPFDRAMLHESLLNLLVAGFYRVKICRRSILIFGKLILSLFLVELDFDAPFEVRVSSLLNLSVHPGWTYSI